VNPQVLPRHPAHLRLDDVVEPLGVGNRVIRGEILQRRVDRAAVELFAARGVDGVSIADIASAAGASQGALYRHYRSKDALAAQLFTEAYLRPLFARAIGPFRWMALSGAESDIARIDVLLLEMFPDNKIITNWIRLAPYRNLIPTRAREVER